MGPSYPLAWIVAFSVGVATTLAFLLAVPPEWGFPLAFPFLICSTALAGYVAEKVLRR